MLYQIQDGSLSFGEKVILSHVNMEIKGKEKIGIVGPNGTGKTSLLKVISGELSLDRDDKRLGRGIVSSRQLRIGKLSQDNSAWNDWTVEEILLSGFRENEIGTSGSSLRLSNDAATDGEAYHLMIDFSAERFYYEQRYDRMLNEFGFSLADKAKRLHEFSGGEQTKIMLVRLLLTEADILLLDEPTNHLDEDSVIALENYLTEYSGAVVAVSHDRYFLDRTATVIYELEDTRLTRYSGNYTAYRKEKRLLYEKQLKAYERQQQEIEKNEQLIRQFKNKPRKAAFARSRKTILERMERIEKPKMDMGHIFTGELKPEYPGPKWMLRMEDLEVGFSAEKSLLGKLELRVRRGQKIGVIGKNGIGKSTLLKTLIGDVAPLKGSYQFGERVAVGYFDQSTGQMQSEEKVSEYFHRLFPGMLEKDMYGKLAAFLFQGAVCQQKISFLSGGEKARLKLCELMTACPNFMILDEPTNHMDIPAKETIESAFRAYTGTMLIVSHDRYFLDQVADAMLVLEEGAAYYYPFGYSHYIKRRQRMSELLEKGVSLEDLPGMLSTQDQAMVASLKAVPKAERHETRQMSDDEAYIDWKLRLAREPLAEAERQVGEAYAEYLLAEKEYQESLLREYQHSEAVQLQNALMAAKSRYDEMTEKWNEMCMNWFEIWNAL